MKPLLPVAALLTVALAAPAAASTLPRADFKAGQLTAAVGLLDANLDYALSDHVSIGVTGAAFTVILAGFASAGVRATTRMAQGPMGTFGLHLAGGVSDGFGGATESPGHGWGYGGLVYTSPAFGSMTVRASFGGMVAQFLERPSSGPTGPQFTLVPNVELAFRQSPTSELTIGGNSLVGWRWTNF